MSNMLPLPRSDPGRKNVPRTVFRLIQAEGDKRHEETVRVRRLAAASDDADVPTIDRWARGVEGPRLNRFADDEQHVAGIKLYFALERAG